MMEKYNNERLANIRSIIQEKTDVTFTNTSRRFSTKYCVVFAACVMCFMALSAFAYYKFNSINGDDLALSSAYLGEGRYEVIVTNMSEHDLKIENNIKVMQWSTGDEVEGKKGNIQVTACDIPAGEKGIVLIDISEAYDIDLLQATLDENDWYYFVLTNNGFAFGQDWMCSFGFDVCNEEDAIAAHDNYVEYLSEEIAYEPSYENGVLVFDDWALPVKEMKISCYFGKQNNGAVSDHISIKGNEGDEVFAVSDGVVIDAGFDITYGNYVILAVSENTDVMYGHLKTVNVSKDDLVSKNDVIGFIGKTGKATGANLSLSVKVDGEYIDPIK